MEKEFIISLWNALKDPKSAAIRRDCNGKLFIVFDLDYSEVNIRLEDEWFPYINNCSSYDLTYLFNLDGEESL